MTMLPNFEPIQETLSREAIELSRHPNAGSDHPRDQESMPRALARTTYHALTTHSLPAVEFLSMPIHRCQRFFLTTPTQASHKEANTKAEVSPALQALSESAAHWLPVQIELHGVEVDFTPLGTASAPTERLATTATTTFESNRHSTQPPLEDLLSALTERGYPHALQVIVRLEDEQEGTLAATVRVVDLHREARWHTRDAEASYRSTTSMPSVTEYFEAFKPTSNRALPLDYGWHHREETRLPETSTQPILELDHPVQRNDYDARLAAELATTPLEYARLLTGPKPLGDLTKAYHELGVSPWLSLDSEALPAIYALTPHTYTTLPYADHDGRAAPHVTHRTTIRTPPNDPAKSTPTTYEHTPTPPASTNNTTNSTPTESTPIPAIQHNDSELATQAARWLTEHGDHVDPLPADTPGSFTRTTPSGQTDLVVVLDGDIHRGDLIATAAYADTHDAYTSTLVIAATPHLAQDARHTLNQPFRILSGRPETVLESQTAPLETQTWQAVRSIDSPPVRWLRTQDTLYCYFDGDIVASTDASNPATALLEDLPRVHKDEHTWRVRDTTGTIRERYTNTPAFRKAWQPILAPARPTRLATGLEATTILVADGSQLQEHNRYPASEPNHTTTTAHRTRLAEGFLETYTIPSTTSTLEADAIVPQFAAWARHQTTESLDHQLATALNIAAPKLSNTPPNPTDTHINRTWRYPPHPTS
ncbi:hypothetical protein [Halobacterium salinarum]|uniref:hypothetical protein n=1 Tax=Halobacterium salinarum TaxID=2242 RepID=UPI0025535F18|nr:hypothetical protein [Halobacterium salinarum]MDL0143537.1 hypothetical protein [Halobacterium salinarum]